MLYFIMQLLYYALYKLETCVCDLQNVVASMKTALAQHQISETNFRCRLTNIVDISPIDCCPPPSPCQTSHYTELYVLWLSIHDVTLDGGGSLEVCGSEF